MAVCAAVLVAVGACGMPVESDPSVGGGDAPTPAVSTTDDDAEPPTSTTAMATPPTSAPATTEPTPSPSDSSGWPAFASTIGPVTAERLGPTWQPGCPVAPADLRLVRVTYAAHDGTAEIGELIVAAAGAEDIVAVFEQIYAAHFPITRMQTIEAYGGDDDASMAADNTSAFNCRPVTGGSGWSRHAYGLAVDINPLRNPYVSGSTVLPPAGADYLDRSDVRPGMIVAGDIVVTVFAAYGFRWGGNFDSLKDYQHFDR